ncbi:TSUP family transporter [Candidatus Pelagibacter sp.]|nr:TSUP family transporter [Candidatus Pelagibacter sp.]
MDIQQYFYLIILLIILQSVVGVGILVVGTPLLLLLNNNIIDIIDFLLPISIITSFINLIFIRMLYQKKLKFYFDNSIDKKFFLYCVPGIFFGIFLIKNFHNYLNFELLVSLIILLSLLIKYRFAFLIKNVSNFYIKSILAMIGILHGLSNAGGTLLSLFLTSDNNVNKNQSRYKISFYYFFLALVQYLIFSYTFNKIIDHNMIIYILPLVLIGSVLGNLLNKIVSEIVFRRGIELIAFSSSVVLLMRGLN